MDEFVHSLVQKLLYVICIALMNPIANARNKMNARERYLAAKLF